jgi:RNA 2',3'-cyclic 3'-phosphodiesterase
VRWVRPEGLHLTLAFLGDVEQERIEILSSTLGDAAQNNDSFNLRLAGCGVFPAPEKAKVIWVGTDQGTNELIKLKNMLDQKLLALGFEKEARAFKPHLTLGRVRYRLDQELIRNFLEREANFRTDAVSVNGFTLFESRLTAQGAYYYPLQVFNFT